MGFKRRCPSLALSAGVGQGCPCSKDKKQRLQKGKGNGQPLLLGAGSCGLGAIRFQQKQEHFLGLCGIGQATGSVLDAISRISLSDLDTVRVMVPCGQELDNTQTYSLVIDSTCVFGAWFS